MLHNYSSYDETFAQYHSVQLMLPQPFFFAKARSLALANFYAGLSGVPDSGLLQVLLYLELHMSAISQFH
jgi:hypothetical protein